METRTNFLYKPVKKWTPVFAEMIKEAKTVVLKTAAKETCPDRRLNGYKRLKLTH